MGRELRRVPANYKHPTYEHFDLISREYRNILKPLYDGLSFRKDAAEWLRAFENDGFDLDETRENYGKPNERDGFWRNSCPICGGNQA